MPNQTWNDDNGKKRINRLQQLLSKSSDRLDFRSKYIAERRRNKLFEDVSSDSIAGKLRMEEEAGSELGKLWAKLPRGNRKELMRGWDDEKKEAFKRDWPILPVAALKAQYRTADGKEYANYQLSCIGRELGVSRNLKGSASTRGGSMVQIDPKDQLATEEQLIAKREANEITIEAFLSGLVAIKSELAAYWKVINDIIVAKRILRNTDLLSFAQELGLQDKNREHKLNPTRGILKKFEEWGALYSFKVESHVGYFCNLADFYTSEELYKLVPEKERQRILKHVTEIASPLSQIAHSLSGDEQRGIAFLRTFLAYYVELGLVKFTK